MCYAKQVLFSLFVVALRLQIAASFGVPLRTFSSGGHATQRSKLFAKHDATSEPPDGDFDKIPQLPAIGTSSFSKRSVHPEAPLVTSEDPNSTVQGNFVSPKFELQYTCNVCETRNQHMVSRVAYREGVVIAVCKGCKSKHLIADNLGTGLDYAGERGDRNIEEYFQNRGMEDLVSRVGREVFQFGQSLAPGYARRCARGR